VTEGAAAISLPRREKLALFGLALAARAAAVAVLGGGVPRFGDSAAYVRAAETFWKTGTYPSRTDLALFRPPGYPVFLALSTWGRPDRIAWDLAWNAVLGALSVLVLASLAGRVAGSLRAARFAGVAAALHPPLLILSADVQSEPLFLLLLLAAGFLLLVSVDRPSSGCGLLSGAALALAALTRPSALALVPLLAAPLFDRRFPAAVRRSLAASALFGLCAVLLPWTARNAFRFHALLPVNDGGALVFWQGNSAWAVRYDDARSAAEMERWSRDFNESVERPEIPGAADPNPGIRSRAFCDAALGWIRAHPREELGVLRAKAKDWLRPGADPRFWPRGVVLASAAGYAALAVLAAAGLARAPRRGVAALAIVVLAVSMAAHVATIVALRYRVPYWDPVLLLYASASAAKVLRRHAA